MFRSLEQNAQLLRGISPQDFLRLGVQQIAYIRPVIVNQTPAWSLHAADGTALAVEGSQAKAEFLARQNDLEPMLLH